MNKSRLEDERAWLPHASPIEKENREKLRLLFQASPIPPEELLDQVTLYLRRQNIADILILDQLYRRILRTPGLIIEFGVRYGRRLSLLSALRGLYEPFNYERRILGFDTFAGFPAIAEEDGRADSVKVGSFSVPPGYISHLTGVLELIEQESPISHMTKIRVLQGDAPEQLATYLRAHPETVIALAYFDMDLYQPTRRCLELIKPCLAKGSILAFDEFSHPEFPGETIALKELFPLSEYHIERLPGFAQPVFITI
jgi:hypothetical protein